MKDNTGEPELLNKNPAFSENRFNVRVNDEKAFLKDYGGEIRQIAITGHGKIKPAPCLITATHGL